mgnify:CR=1 FL=1
MIKLTPEEVAFIKQMEKIHPDLGQWTYDQLKLHSIATIKGHLAHVIKNIDRI